MKIKEYVSWQEVNKIVFIFDERNNDILKLEGLSADIWKKCVCENLSEEYLSYIEENFNVSRFEATQDKNDIINDLFTKEIIDNE